MSLAYSARVVNHSDSIAVRRPLHDAVHRLRAMTRVLVILRYIFSRPGLHIPSPTMPSDETPVPTSAKTNGVHADPENSSEPAILANSAGEKVNRVNAETPTAVLADVAQPTPAAVPAVPDKEEDADAKAEREMKARKLELDALNAQYKDVAHGSKAELVHLDKVRTCILL